MKKLLTCLLLLFTANLWAQPAPMLDYTFGDFNLGKVWSYPLQSYNTKAYAIGVQSDGKIVIAGSIVMGNQTQPTAILVARYYANGKPDSTFSAVGATAATFTSDGDMATSLAIQTDGKIVVAGWTKVGLTKHFAVMRFMPDGLLDNSFSTDGKASIDFGENNQIAHSVVINNEDKIIVGGSLDNRFFGIAQLNSDGSLDTGFSGDGMIVTDVLAGRGEHLSSVAVQPDGKILAGGYVNGDQNDDIAVIRYNTNGTPDIAFNGTGKVITDLNQGQDQTGAMALQSDGKIVVAGHSMLSNVRSVMVIRYTSAGTLDAGFGQGGIGTKTIAGANTEINSIAIDSQGRITAAGQYNPTGSIWKDYLITRFTLSGIPDNTFGGDGYTITDYDAYNDYLNAITVQPDDKILATGNSDIDWTGELVTIARYVTDMTIGLVEFSPTETAPLLYPNPLQNTEHLNYTLADDEQISIVLLDGQGKLVATFIENEKQVKGDHEVELNLPNGLPSGNYFIQIASPKGKISIKSVK